MSLFVRMSKACLDRQLEIFPHVVNFVDARDRLPVRWLKWLGFELDPEPVANGPFGTPFYRFELKTRLWPWDWKLIIPLLAGMKQEGRTCLPETGRQPLTPYPCPDPLIGEAFRMLFPLRRGCCCTVGRN